ncbi:Dabb family protein [Microbacterium sp. YY-01]|uniref:Dabb family protein n=1 Tax=Microbacterium sp. YY-01 TaxID=3421634 RepID=UPI003D1805A1
MTLRHVVMWKMAAPDAPTRREHAQECARRLQALEGVVPQLLSISAGANTEYADVNWDITLIADFADLAALEAYQMHPAHEEAATYIRSVAGGRAAVDYTV